MIHGSGDDATALVGVPDLVVRAQVLDPAVLISYGSSSAHRFDCFGAETQLGQDLVGVLADAGDRVHAFWHALDDRWGAERLDSADGGIDLTPAVTLGQLRVGDQVDDFALAGVGDLGVIEARDHLLGR